MQLFNKALMGSTPLFQIETILSAPEILLQPKSNEVYKLIMNCVRNCVDGTKVGPSSLAHPAFRSPKE